MDRGRRERELALGDLEATTEWSPAVLVNREIAERLDWIKHRRDEILGEVFVRHWLSKDNLPSFLQEIFDASEYKDSKEEYLNEIFPRRTKPEKRSPRQRQFDCKSVRYAEKRTLDYLNCDGLFAFSIEELEEAIVVPFKLHESGLHAKGFFDASNSRLSKWEDLLDPELGVLSDRILAIQINVPFGDLDYRGRSFLLPLALASRRLNNPFLPHPLTCIATGDIKKSSGSSRLESVEEESIPLKEALAETLGATFIGPRIEESPSASGYTSGESLEEFLDRWESQSEEMKEKPTSDDAFKILDRIEMAMKERRYPHEKTIRFLNHCLPCVEESNDRNLATEAWRFHLSLGAAHNHLGNPSDAERHHRQALKILKDSEGSPERIVTLSHRVVEANSCA